MHLDAFLYSNTLHLVLAVFRCFYMIAVKFVLWEAGFLQFSGRSRDQLKAKVLIYRDRLLPTKTSPTPSLVLNAAKQVSQSVLEQKETRAELDNTTLC